jgi:hypothetical protein
MQCDFDLHQKRPIELGQAAPTFSSKSIECCISVAPQSRKKFYHPRIARSQQIRERPPLDPLFDDQPDLGRDGPAPDSALRAVGARRSLLSTLSPELPTAWLHVGCNRPMRRPIVLCARREGNPAQAVSGNGISLSSLMEFTVGRPKNTSTRVV